MDKKQETFTLCAHCIKTMAKVNCHSVVMLILNTFLRRLSLPLPFTFMKLALGIACLNTETLFLFALAQNEQEIKPYTPHYFVIVNAKHAIGNSADQHSFF